MNTLRRLFAWGDRRRARDFLQHACDDLIEARMKLDEANRRADRALKDAQKLEAEGFRREFFDKRDPVRSAFVGKEAA